MSSFEEDYNKRLRRVAGLEDDTIEVRAASDSEDGYWEGYCETCQYWNEGKTFVKIQRMDTYEVLSTFEDMGDLIRALDAVEL